MSAKKCKKSLCVPLNRELLEVKPGEFAWIEPTIVQHHEGCPLWAPPLPADGERLEFGIHRQRRDDAESAPAWSPLDELAKAKEKAFRRFVRGAR